MEIFEIKYLQIWCIVLRLQTVELGMRTLSDKRVDMGYDRWHDLNCFFMYCSLSLYFIVYGIIHQTKDCT